MKRVVVSLLMALLFMGSLAGCGGSVHKMPERKSFAEELYAAKNPYIGNNSADGKLLGLLRVGSFGRYTFEIKSDAHPYTLTIRMMYTSGNFDEAVFKDVMKKNALLLLALIDNCELVEWTYPTSAGSQYDALGVEYANTMAGTDIKKAAKKEETFIALCDKMFPEKAAKEKAAA